jgi:hypothetical protein
MRRRTLDLLLTWVGVLLTVTLLGAGGLLVWGYSFASSTVHTQMAAQKIYFPAKGSSELSSPLIKPYLTPYAGQQLLTGQEAEVYADHFIAVHLQEIGGGLTYSQLSAKAMANPTNKTLAGQVQTMFQGTMLRSTLLTAYAFSVFAMIALWSMIACFALGILTLLLTLLGLRHYRRVDPEIVI